jgi:hypothetical protein
VEAAATTVSESTTAGAAVEAVVPDATIDDASRDEVGRDGTRMQLAGDLDRRGGGGRGR